MSTLKQKALESKLDGRQRKAALLCVERDFATEEERRTFDSIAEEIGITRKTLHQWRTQNKTFIEYVNLLADDFLAADRAFVYRQLMKTISGPQPSVKGIDLYFKRHGLITQHTVVETVDGAGGSSTDDITKDIAELDELLAEEK
ncbi:phBC6A51 family helix-turn-helix protein [Paenibacillus terrigena]|uniref:phBC6A51 family helix-turn-helix protein n=1 Tax=Paenibacillus terrigena TaxID=369333 RepID=UPI0028D0A50E|nr:phBC6A51 family helix-turn-helix protein [Paenibacillus terrigena]